MQKPTWRRHHIQVVGIGLMLFSMFSNGAILVLGAPQERAKSGTQEQRSAAPEEGREAEFRRGARVYRLRAARLQEEEKIVLDGLLNEPVWRRADVAENFIQTEPREGEPATEPTEARVAYDREMLYIGIVAYDSEIHRLIINELRKDFNLSNGDVVQVVLDTFFDRRNGYEFATNPGGAKWDAQMSNEGREVNSDWDGIWHVRTQINERAWTVEMAIPFRTLKFRAGDTQVWGINFMRRIRRKNEESYWAPIPRMFNSIHYVSRAGVLEGLEDIRPGTNIRIKPYVIGSMADFATRGPTTHRVFRGDGGVDAKWGVTSGLTLDVTYNTDFSQVEADEQQINLTRFSLFFPEKRDFFLEGSGIFRFGPGEQRGGMMGEGGMGGGGLGGRLGAVRNDLILFFSRRIGLSESGEPIPLRAGVRLTGRAGPYELGFLNIQQEALGLTPATNFLVTRVRRNVLANSDLGFMFMNVARAHAFNRIYGADANFRFFQNLNLHGYLAKATAPGLRGDTMAWRVGMSWRNNFWNTRHSFTSIGENFRNELGFIPRLGIRKASDFLGLHWRPRAISRTVREIFPHWQIDYIMDPSGRLDTRLVDYHLPINFQNGAFLEVGVNSTYERLIQPFRIHPTVIVPVGRYSFNEYFLLFNSDRSRPLSVSFRLGTGPFYNGYRQSYSSGANVRVSYRFNTSFTYTRNNIRLSTGQFQTDLLTLRAAYSFSTSVFLNALVQYNSVARTWSSNIRFNIIHRPLSDLFIVYNERRESGTGRLLDRALLVKFTYAFNF
ncbi:MAG: carbohydrate binding family 9 domain-containing protein [Blastocatellia bacterium]|nr:carbohydrate binding family 9 domain-containing protein [Blastocatellia bacterium]MCS7157508.1 carbohydrate binding family 9 domain-containing protein [Blastocatellia bacterium]MCX7752681.1 carbohydrate binding family 9 domain-containing protein [Blastocatellia bacterium]MDW8168412.1 DUF5916 domain-containing protein [Acidobacteriota bacterium]MDW8255608.1 DUF5916 domain-containing protein [Acidobacteriota bacterium]